MRAPIALDASHSVWPIAASDGSSASAWSTFHPGGDAGITPRGAPLYLYGPYIREGFATAPSNNRVVARTRISATKQTPQVRQRGWLFSMQRWLGGFAAAHTAVARMIDQAEREAPPDRIDGSSASPQNRPDERLRGRRLAPDRAPAEPGRGCRAGFPR